MNELSEALWSPWIVVGLAGQAAFSARFLVQWLISEWRRQSIIPKAFWYLSLVGSALLLVYAVARRDPVFILGQSFGFVVYSRNLMLLHRTARPSSENKL
ncbi:MAG: lipid-A-disaccharide synthase N-terminal domain-containing protein [Planctomycetes bacterium]|nr:lipid-A-disaccharide synthase N-terminal domain-containing protein [Planctomycetota bacterium]